MLTCCLVYKFKKKDKVGESFLLWWHNNFAKLKTWAPYACSFTLACMIAFRDLISKTTKDINTIFVVHMIYSLLKQFATITFKISNPTKFQHYICPLATFSHTNPLNISEICTATNFDIPMMQTSNLAVQLFFFFALSISFSCL